MQPGGFAMFEVVSGLLAVVLLAAMAFPHIFLTMKRQEKKLVGSSYWGVYKGLPTEDAPENQKIQMPDKSRNWMQVVAGSAMYAGKK